MKICTVIYDAKDIYSEIKVLYTKDFFLKNEIDVRQDILFTIKEKFEQEFLEISPELKGDKNE
jgi:hypothetical protein